MRHVTAEAFPASWPLGETALRSHASGDGHRTFGLRPGEMTSQTLEASTQTLDRSAAAIIRQLIAQGRPEDCPPSWLLAVQEHRASPASMAWAHERGPAHAVVMGAHQGAAARHPEPSPGAGTPDHPGVPRRTSGPVGTATASQVTPPHARASGAAALAQVARSMRRRSEGAAM
jgi:hypothetical protein